MLEVLSREEINRLGDVARSERDRVIVRLLADTGMRAGELVGLSEGDLIERGRDRYLRVHGKGARERLVPIQPPLFRRIQRLVRGRPSEVHGDRIFESMKRMPRGGYQPLGATGLN